jgi:hypothetical protein
MLEKIKNTSGVAPIALFVYNRPFHVLETIKALSNNILASDSDLHIFSDAPKKNPGEIEVLKVRELIRNITGFKNIFVVEQKTNLGLANSIVQGVTSLCERYGRVIVLEDDIVTSKFFLQYMNDALNFYSDTDNVMHISGYRYPVKTSFSSDTFFLHLPMCWGWGTWQRSWVKFNRRLDLIKYFNDQSICKFNFNNSYPYWKQIELNKAGQISTWFVFWYAILFYEKKLALFPCQSLAQNIGIDGSGTNTRDVTYDYRVELYNLPIIVNEIPLIESVDAYKAHCEYFTSIKKGFIKKIINKLKIFIKKYTKICFNF